MTRAGIVVDRDDSLATVRAVRELERRWPQVLVVAIAPGSRSEIDVAAAVLRALGKRLDTLPRRPAWLDVDIWLAEHEVTELVVLCAQHLSEAALLELETRADEHVLDVTLIYGGAGQLPTATITREHLLSRSRTAGHCPRPHPSFPNVPDAHPLRFRYECAHALTAEEFATVDEIHRATWHRFSAWLRTHRGESRRRLELVVALADAGIDQNHSRIRRQAVTLALIDAQVPAPDTFESVLRPGHLTTDQVKDALAQINPQAAGHRLVEHLTGMSSDHLQVVGGDQVGDSAILGNAVPDCSWPILRALNPRPEARLEPPIGEPSASPNLVEISGHHRPTRRARRLAQALSQALDGPSGCVGLRGTTSETRADLNRLVRLGIITRDEHVYRPTAAALDSDYQLRRPPPPPLTSRDWNR